WQTRVAPNSWTRRAPLLRANALGLFAKAPPRHGSLPARPTANASELDERETAGPGVASGALLHDIRWAIVSHPAGLGARPRSALALACAGERRQFAGRAVGTMDFSHSR